MSDQITISEQNKVVVIDDSHIEVISVGIQGPAGSGSAGSAISRTILSVSTATTAAATAKTDYVYLVSGTTTLTLPTAVGNTNKYSITNVGTSTVTIATTSSQTINGSLTASMPIPGMSLDLISNNVNWIIE